MTLSAVPVDDGRNLNLAVIGTGAWGQTQMRAISTKAGLTLAAVISSKPEVTVPEGISVPVFSTWQTAVDTFAIDGFVFAVPPDVQPAIAAQIIAAGIPVFLEKPVALDHDAARRLLAAAQLAGFTGVVDHVHLFAPEFAELCRLLPSDNRAKSITTISGNKGPYRDQWTACWDWAPHDIAMCLAVMDAAPASVTARIVRSVEQEARVFENYEIDLDFGQRGRAMIITGNAYDGHRREFRVQSGDISLTYAETADRHRSLIVEQNGRAEAVDVVTMSPLDAALAVFAHRVRQKSVGIEDLERGVLVVDICAAVHEAVARGVPVPITGH
jgi:predicted dehydrogenase